MVAREGSHNGGLILMIDMFYNNNDDLLLRMKTTCKLISQSSVQQSADR